MPRIRTAARPTDPINQRNLRRNLWSAVGAILGLLTLLALVGCAAGAGAASTPNTSPATHISGPIDISTDHSIYGPTETINVTITNSLTKPIIAYDTQSGCSVLQLQHQQDGQWLPANEAHCPMGRVAAPITIKPGVPYHAAIRAGFSGMPSSGAQYFTPGTYRLAFEYFLAPLGSQGSQPTGGTQLLSESFSVVGAVPATTPPSGSKGGGPPIYITPAGTVTATR